MHSLKRLENLKVIQRYSGNAFFSENGMGLGEIQC